MVAETQFHSIAQLKERTLVGLAEWSSEQLHYKSSAGSWSALQVVDHLARTDASITAQMSSNAAAPLPLSMANRAAGAAFNVMFRSPLRVKTPASASAILPATPTDLEAAAASWNASISGLRSFLEGLDTEPAGALFRHPVAGPMSLSTALDFVETHTRHHLHQLARIHKTAHAALGGTA